MSTVPNSEISGARNRKKAPRIRGLALRVFRHQPLVLIGILLLGVGAAAATTWLVLHADRVDRDLARRKAESQQHRLAYLNRMSVRHDKRIAALHNELQALGHDAARRGDLDASVVEVRGLVQNHVKKAVATVERNFNARLSTEVHRKVGDHPDVVAARNVVRRLEALDSAVERIVRRYSPSICMIQGSYGFARRDGPDKPWRFLREVPVRTLDRKEGRVALTLDGEGPLFKVDFTGSGFLVDRSGLVLTNRHIGQPWWRNDDAAPLIRDGYVPRFLVLRAYFPGRKRAVHFEVHKTLVSDDADVACLAFHPTGRLPEPLPLAEDGARVGRRVLLMGYPSGLRALLAKAGEGFLTRFKTTEDIDPVRLLDELADEGLVRPLPTEGRIGDILPDKILYDAPTAVGASGGPVLNREGKVVAVNYGILKAFSSANFGVPIEHGRKLVLRAKRRKNKK